MNGTLSRAAWAPASSWSAAYSETSAKQLRLVSESLTQNFDKVRSAALLGSAAENEFYNGHQMIAGELVVDLAYDNSEILEYCLGSAASTTYSFTDALSKVFHLCIDKNSASASSYRYNFAGCKVASFTISGEPGETPVRLSMQLICRSLAIVSTAFPTVTAPDEPLLFKHLSTFWIGANTATLSSSDALPVKSFEVSVDNALQADAKDTSDTSYVLEPVRNGFRKVTLKLGLARYLTTAPTSSLLTWKTGGTKLSAIAMFSNGTDTYTFNIPLMKITEGVTWNVGGPGMIEADVTLEAFKNDSSTTGSLSGVTDQMQIIAV